jgi:large subunit ribosomal protein L15
MFLRRVQKLKKRKRVGRGMSSGSGKTCNRGQKGQNSRSGPGFNFSPHPLEKTRRNSNYFALLKRKKEQIAVNLKRILHLLAPGVIINLSFLKEKKIVKGKKVKRLKLLVSPREGDFSLLKGCVFQASSFTQGAKKMIIENGGKVVVH